MDNEIIDKINKLFEILRNLSNYESEEQYIEELAHLIGTKDISNIEEDFSKFVETIHSEENIQYLKKIGLKDENVALFLEDNDSFFDTLNIQFSPDELETVKANFDKISLNKKVEYTIKYGDMSDKRNLLLMDGLSSKNLKELLIDLNDNELTYSYFTGNSKGLNSSDKADILRSLNPSEKLSEEIIYKHLLDKSIDSPYTILEDLNLKPKTILKFLNDENIEIPALSKKYILEKTILLKKENKVIKQDELFEYLTSLGKEYPTLIKDLIEGVFAPKHLTEIDKVIQLMKSTEDLEYIKDVIENEEKRKNLGIKQDDIIKLIKIYKELYDKSNKDKTEESIQQIKKLIENDEIKNALGANRDNIIELLLLTKDEEYIYKSGIFKEEDIKYVNSCEYINSHVDEFCIIKGIEGKNKEIILRMLKRNERALKNIKLEFLDEKYLMSLGEDKINKIICYPDIQDKILSLDDNQYNIFCKCIDNFLENAETEEWNVIAGHMLSNISEYKELIENIKNIEDIDKEDLEKLTSIIQGKNNFEIQTIEDVRNYAEIKKNKCDNIINNEQSSIDNVKLATMQKLFGHDVGFAKHIIDTYGVDIKHIKDEDTKLQVLALKELLEIEDKEILIKIYNECENSIEIANKAAIERKLKTEYGKLYNEGLLEVNGLEEIEENVYNAGTDFKMIITSLSPFTVSNYKDNYKDSWNINKMDTDHFCASYIRNDMLGTAPIRSICYGFTDMADDSLLASGATDIFSNEGEFVSEADSIEDTIFYSPDNQINHTNYYNEMDYRRIQNGEKKQPSYIVVFKEDGIIQNLNIAKQASKDWGGLPIVVVDKDACLESEKAKVDKMLEEYEKKPSYKLGKQIMQKIRNNKVSNYLFCSEDEYRKQIWDIEKKIGETEKNGTIEKTGELPKVNLTDLEEIYDKTNAPERSEGVKEIKKIYEKIEEIKKSHDEEGR